MIDSTKDRRNYKELNKIRPEQIRKGQPIYKLNRIEPIGSIVYVRANLNSGLVECVCINDPLRSNTFVDLADNYMIYTGG